MGIRKFFLFFVLIISIIITLVFPISVMADDTTPPPPTEEPFLPPVEDTTNPTSDTIVSPSLIAGATEVPSEQEEILIAPPLLSTLPTDTLLMVEVDGQVEPLATQEAATAVVVGDPIWCPEGASPSANLGGCTDTYINLEDLIDDILNGVITAPSDDGIIWITNTSDTSVSSIEIDGSDPALLAWSNFNLTIQGGWTGTSVGVISGSSAFSVPVSIINWNGSVTVNDLVFSNLSSTGLTIETIDSDIEINNIISINNSGVGSNGVELSVNDTLSALGGDIIVNNLIATNNQGLGLSITGLVNDVTLTNVTTNSNGNNGISVEALGDLSADSISSSLNVVDGAFFDVGGSATVVGTNIFSNNLETGLYIEAVGDIELTDFSTNSNGMSGSGNGTELYSSSGSVSINLGQFDNNVTAGLYVEAFKDIDTENISANDNGDEGVSLNANGGVSVLGVNTFTGNLSNGLYVETVGNIDAENLYADGNGVELHAAGNISISGNNEFLNNNTGSGLFVESTIGSVEVENILASGNFGDGTELLAQSDIAVLGSNVFSLNNGAGLTVNTISGSVDLENITATNNGIEGASITSIGAVYILGSNLFTGNQNTGLYVETSGNIQIENLEASDNHADGVDLISLANVEVSGINIFYNNSNNGLYIDAGGDVSLENINASGNGGGLGSGTELNSSGNINLTGNNQFNNNIFDGLLTYAVGDVYIENTDALDNGGVGVYIDTPDAATVVCSLMSGNNGYQLEADTGGYLTLVGTNFGANIDTDLGADEDRLILVSNSCFTYSFPSDDEGDGFDGDTLSEAQVITPPLPIANKVGVDRQVTSLDCNLYSGTTLSLENGNSAYIPCPIIDSARLADIPELGLVKKLPNDRKFVSAFILDIYRNGQLIGLGNESGLVDFSSIYTPANIANYVYIYWDGTDWVEVTDQTFPFMGVYFSVSPDMLKDRDNLAILFWNGSEWVELIDGVQLGQGREVGLGGRFIDFEGKTYFGATVNFTGVFVLVKK